MLSFTFTFGSNMSVRIHVPAGGFKEWDFVLVLMAFYNRPWFCFLCFFLFLTVVEGWERQ